MARTGGQRRGGWEGTQGQGQGRNGHPETDRTGHGSHRGRAERKERDGAGAPPQPDVQPVRCIPPGIQRMLAHHTHHHHHHHAHLYNIKPATGDLIPPKPPRPQHQPAPPCAEGGA